MKHKQKLQGYDAIPIIIGVTGHRDIFCGKENDPEDCEEIKAQIEASIKEIISLCDKNTPVIMLNALAQGADMLCAEVAFDCGIPVYAVLPCEEEKYLLSFDDCGCGRNHVEDKKRFYELLNKCTKVIISSDQERLSKGVKESNFDNTESYDYRQLGIYMAKHSHFLFALWDGNESTNQYGCGAAEVVKFALTHDYLDSEHVPVPGTINDSAVIWIKCRRKKSGCNSAKTDGCSNEIKKIYRIKDIDNFSIDSSDKFPYKDSDSCPACIAEMIKKTVRYNAEAVFTKGEIADYLWGDNSGKSNEIKDEDLNSLRSQYFKADLLATKYRDSYQHRMLAVAILSVCVAFSFLIYDDCSIFWMIYPCFGCLLAAIVITFVCGIQNKDYHRKYIQYRAVAEVLRTQFYICACGTKAFICDEFSWTQKSDMVWIEKAMRTLFILHDFNKPLDKNKIKESWIIGQYNYHESQLKENKKKTHKRLAKTCRRATSTLFIVSIILYSVILLLESLSLFGILDFWEGTFYNIETISWRNVGAVIVGLSAVITLFFSSYFDKLSNERKSDDHAKMKNLYIYALRNWDNILNDKMRFNRFIINIAREEIVENGIWYSYVNESGLQVNI